MQYTKFMQASEEQLAIIAALKHSNVAVNAVAGSGKTTTVKFIAQEYEDKAILVLTYNKSLQIDTETRLTDHANASVHTIHAFAYNFYDSRESYGDNSIFAALEKQLIVPVTYDIIIIDECQDLTQLYYNFILKIIADTSTNNSSDTATNNSGATICLLGDIRQCIYKYKGSDTKYLEQPSKYFPNNGLSWQYLQLSQSYRIDTNMASFINTCMYSSDTVISSDKQPKEKISYIHLKKDNNNELLFSAIYDVIEKYNHDDIMILAPSLNKDGILQDISNKLSKSNVALYYSKENTSGNKKALMNNKLAISTIHAAKGMERKVIILYRFDESYYYFQKFAPKNICDNLLYVALTRASEKLIIIHNSQYNYLPYFDSAAAANYCDIINTVSLNTKSVIVKEQVRFSATSLIEHLPFELENKLAAMLNIKKYYVAAPYTINNCINNKLGSSDIVEDVYSINGMLVPLYNSYLFDKNNFHLQILNFIDAAKHDFAPQPERYKKSLEFALLRDPNIDEYTLLSLYYNPRSSYSHKIILEFLSKERLENLNYNQMSAHDMSRLATAIYCINEKLIYKHNQLKNKYGWLNDCDIEELSGRIEAYLDDTREYELSVCKNIGQYIISGRIDCLSSNNNSNTVWEYKCVSQLTNSHILQLALYAYLFEGQQPNTNSEYKLFNVLSGEIIEISASASTYAVIAQELLANKINKPISQNSFFDNKAITDKYVLPNIVLRNGTKYVIDVDDILVKLYFINQHDHELLTSCIENNAAVPACLANSITCKKYTLANLVRLAKAIYAISCPYEKKIKYTPPSAEQIKSAIA